MMTVKNNIKNLGIHLNIIDRTYRSLFKIFENESKNCVYLYYRMIKGHPSQACSHKSRENDNFDWGCNLFKCPFAKDWSYNNGNDNI